MTRRRRDPRAERARHAVPAAEGARPRFTIETPAPTGRNGDAAGAHSAGTPPGRPRRDPRREAAAHVVPGPRHRLDRARGAAVAPAVADAALPAVVESSPPARAGDAAGQAAVRIIAEPAFHVAVVPDLPGGRATARDRQLLGAARLLADAGGGAVVVLASAGDDWGTLGADRMVEIAVSDHDAYDPEGRAAAVGAAVRALAPRHVVFAETADGGDLARRVAADLGEPLFAGAESLSARAVTRAAKAGLVEQRTAPPRLISLSADVVAPHAGPRHEARPLAIAPDPADAAPARGIRAATPIPADPATVPLAEAAFVVSAGNGVHDLDAFRRLTAALGATPGASRVLCDAGLMPRDRQVGASGTVLAADCYFALGIAGAPQHLQGVAKCEHVVAVNTDLHAAMIERAGLAVVADAQAVMPALLAALAEETAGTETGRIELTRGAASGEAARDPTARPPAMTTGARAQGHLTADADPLPDPAAAPLSAVVLLSAGRHPASGRAAPVRAEAQATALALGLGAAPRGLHAGLDATAVADHLGHGLAEIGHLGLPADADALPGLVAALSAAPPDIILAGRRGRGGDDGGALPYRLAAALGRPIVADAVSLSRDPADPSCLVVEQALPRGARRRVIVSLPAVVTVHPAAPPPRPFAFAPARRGRIVPLDVTATARDASATKVPAIEERPWRRRPRLIAGATAGGTAAERLKAATEVAGGGRVLVDPDPAEAAREILAFLRAIGVLAPPAR